MARPWILVLLLTGLVLISWPAGAGQEGQPAPGRAAGAAGGRPAAGGPRVGGGGGGGGAGPVRPPAPPAGDYADSVHGAPVLSRTGDGATCIDCHSPDRSGHSTSRLAGLRSAAPAGAGAENCGRGHADGRAT